MPTIVSPQETFIFEGKEYVRRKDTSVLCENCAFKTASFHTCEGVNTAMDKVFGHPTLKEQNCSDGWVYLEVSEASA